VAQSFRTNSGNFASRIRLSANEVATSVDAQIKNANKNKQKDFPNHIADTLLDRLFFLGSSHGGNPVSVAPSVLPPMIV
jgi:hypothetical protein